MPSRKLRCPAPGCDWSSSTWIDPDQLPVNCPKCGCPIHHFADDPDAPRAVAAPKWKVYRFDKPEIFVIVEWPSYEPMRIKSEAIKRNPDKLAWADTPNLRVRRYEEDG